MFAQWFLLSYRLHIDKYPIVVTLYCILLKIQIQNHFYSNLLQSNNAIHILQYNISNIVLYYY
jgi:hypothetical protein